MTTRPAHASAPPANETVIKNQNFTSRLLVEQRRVSAEAAIELRFLESRFSRGEGQFRPGAALTGAQHPALRN
jgi:hypothetical protein